MPNKVLHQCVIEARGVIDVNISTVLTDSMKSLVCEVEKVK